MNLLPFLFWGLVLATLVISLRWGAMIGLVAFVLALLLGAVAISRLSPDKGMSTVQSFGRAPLVGEARGADVPAVTRNP